MHLPQELIIEILLRLQVKSLVRFKCVCKSWFSLISDPHFAISHFELAAAPTRGLVHRAKNASREIQSIDLDASLIDESASASVMINILTPRSYSYLYMGGSCRGFQFLMCYCLECLYYLWNPSTGVHKQIPPSPIESSGDTDFSLYLYGLGYDPSMDDYLVVLGSYDIASDGRLTHLEFFSLRANTWKEIECAHSPCVHVSEDPTFGSFLNGAIHWLAYRHDISVNVIISFDLMERRLSEIPLSDDFDEDPTYCGVWVFGGRVSLWVLGHDHTVGIWVMEEYRVHSSWTKTLVLPVVGIPSGFFSPLYSTKSGDIVGKDGSAGLWKYNDRGQLLEHHYLPYGSQVAMYTESLLSLPGDSEQA